jgi:hypothetical protein
MIDVDGHVTRVPAHYFSNISHVMQIHVFLTSFNVIEGRSLVVSKKARLHDGDGESGGSLHCSCEYEDEDG